MAKLLSDDDVRAELPPTLAVDAARRALVDAHQRRLQAPPRLSADVGSGSMVFTAGGYAGGAQGVRVYLTGGRPSDQTVLVWEPGGRLAACVVGVELGALRTGALGGAAADALARPDARVAGVVGSGRQAWTQLWALAAVRRLEQVRVFSPTVSHREAFADRARRELGWRQTLLGPPVRRWKVRTS